MKIPKIKFIFDRRKKSSKTKPGSVDMRITYGSTQVFISTGITVLPHQWHESTQRVVASSTAMEHNELLAQMERKALKIASEMLENNRVDIHAIPSLLRSQTASMTFLEYVARRIKQKKVTEHTHRSYITMANKLEEFGKIKYFYDITPGKIRAFSEWLHKYERVEKDATGRTVRKMYSQATIYKITSNLSLFISDAVVDGFLPDNPYVTKRMNESKGGTRIDQYLLPDEVEKIEQAAMPTAAVARSRDLFLLQCYTGMAYIDLMTYDWAKTRKAELGLCRGTRHKTGTEFAFVLTDKAHAILERMDYKIDQLSNQKYNAHLKIMADAAGIEKKITTHVGRRTAGSIWLNSGIPIDVVSKCLGHQSIQVTQRAYAKILDTTIVDAFNKIAESR